MSRRRFFETLPVIGFLLAKLRPRIANAPPETIFVYSDAEFRRVAFGIEREK